VGQPRHVAELLHQLQGVDSPVKRLRILARAWRTVRALNPADRRRLAEQLQLEGADRLLEQLGLRDGIDPEAVLQAVNRAESADPSRLRELLQGLGEPDQRRDLAAAAVARLVPADSAGEVEEQANLPDPVLGAGAASGDEPAVLEATRGEARPARSEAGEQEGEPSSHSADPSPRPRARAAARREVPFGQPALDATPAQSTSPSSVGLLTRQVRSLPMAQGRREALAAGQDTTLSLTARLVLVSRWAADLGTMAQEELLALIERFPPGWARRRAIQALYRVGLPGELGDALELADAAAPEDWAHTWCLATLMTNRPLTAAQRMAVLDRARTAPARRRLASLARAR